MEDSAGNKEAFSGCADEELLYIPALGPFTFCEFPELHVHDLIFAGKMFKW